jgi:predicted ATPase
MLTGLRLQGFKSWSETGQIALKPITGFFGPNSSGKTSLIQALLLLKQTADSSDRRLVFHFGSDSTPADLGDFRSIIHEHSEQSELALSLDWRHPKAFRISDTKDGNRLVVEDRRLGFSVVARGASDSRAERVVVEQMCYRVGNTAFGMRRMRKPKPEYEFFAEGTAFHPVRSAGRKWPLPAPIKSYGFPDQVRAYFQNAGFVADLELAFEERLQQVYYLGPLRAYPLCRYTWTGTQPLDMGRAGESAVEAMLASRERGERIGRGRGRPRVTLEQYVAQWLKELGLIHDFRVAALTEGNPIFEVQVRKSAKSPEVLLTDVGFGVSQILPVLVLCFYAPEGATIILEQPEIHLHPRVQSGLADVLVDAWRKRDIQILLESHSEHLLRRLQRRVAEERISQDAVGLYFCKAGDRGSEITPLALDLYGNIGNWPDDFFGDDFGEIAAMSKAALRRRHGVS